MKRLFKKLLTFTTNSLVLIPMTSCSTVQNKEVDTIEIVDRVDDLTLIQDQQYLSKPIMAKCFGPDKQEKQIDIRYRLETQSFDKPPEWICLTNKHEIKINGNKDVGIYKFSIIAYNENEKIQSKPLLFNVNVISERHIVPDSISIEIENNKYCMYGEETTIPINIVPFKEGVEEKYLLKDTICSIDVLKGKNLDKQKKNLFKIGGTNSNPTIIVSQDTDENYIGTYKIRITAKLISNPEIYTYRDIFINIDNIYIQYDSKSKCTFTRKSSDDNWMVLSTAKDTTVLYDIPTVIQNKPVTKISENFCFNSQINDLAQIILPPTIDTIGAHAFANQKALCSIEIPGVKYVGQSAFENDSILEFRSGSILPSFVYVGTKAFYNCKITRIPVQKDIVWIGDFAFKNAGFSRFEVGENCYYIGTESFAECSQLSGFVIKTQKPPLIGGSIFNKTDNLSTINVPIENLWEYKADLYWSTLGKNIEGI